MLSAKKRQKMLEGIVSSFHIFCCCHYTVTVATVMSTSWPHLSFGRKLICLDKISRVQYIWKMGIECPLYNIPSPHSHFFTSSCLTLTIGLYDCICVSADYYYGYEFCEWKRHVYYDGKMGTSYVSLLSCLYSIPPISPFLRLRFPKKEYVFLCLAFATYFFHSCERNRTTTAMKVLKIIRPLSLFFLLQRRM